VDGLGGLGMRTVHGALEEFVNTLKLPNMNNPYNTAYVFLPVLTISVYIGRLALL
jgi:hypothetical protein